MYLTVINILFMLSLLFSIIINLITTVITGVLMYISFALGILNEKNITDIMVLPIITLVSCILIGVVVSACSSRAVLKNVREFIEATDKLGLMSIFWTQKVKLFYAALLANNSH